MSKIRGRGSLPRTTFIFFSLLTSVSGFAATSQADSDGPAWKWSLEKRVHARVALTTGRKSEARSGKLDTPVTINGASEPELFMPSELFRRLVRTGFDAETSGRDLARQEFEIRAREGGLQLPGNFWGILRGAADGYLRTRAEKTELNKQKDSKTGAFPHPWIAARHAELESSSCLALALALSNAREALGLDLMDRFLYTAVAPSSFITILTTETESEIRKLEGGCR